MGALNFAVDISQKTKKRTEPELLKRSDSVRFALKKYCLLIHPHRFFIALQVIDF